MQSRPTALSAARAGVGTLWCAAVMTAALVIDHPLFLVVLFGVVLSAGALCGCRAQMIRSAKFAIPLALAVAVINGLISRDGLTVVARLGEVPVLGRIDVTAEAVVWGLVLGLRVIVVMSVAVLFTAVVDQDALLAIVRRRAGRFGLTTVVASRLMPLLVADGHRFAEANRTLPEGESISRFALVGAIAAGALDRASDAAAALEMRGLGDSPCLARPEKSAWSRHDLAVSVSAFGTVALVGSALALGWVNFVSRSEIHAEWGIPLFGVIALTSLMLLLPFIDKRGIER